MTPRPLTTNQRMVRAWGLLGALGLALWLTGRARGAETEVTVALAPRFRGEEQDFQDMLGNLLDNAGKWASAQVRVTLDLEAGPAGSGQDFLILCAYYPNR